MNRQQALNLLSLNNNATENDIKKKYKELAKIYHPDSNTSESSADKFIQITEAYLFLINNKDSQYIHQNTEAEYKRQAYQYAQMRYEEFRKKEEELNNIPINKILYPSWLNVIFLILSILFLFDYYLPKQWHECNNAYIIEPQNDEEDFVIQACKSQILAERLSLNDIYLLEQNGTIFLKKSRILGVIFSYSINPQRRVYNVTTNRYVTHPILWLSLVSSAIVLFVPLKNVQQKLFAKFLSLVFILSFLLPFISISFAMIV
ncbi:MAG TPA: DnaJ domain-containing protein [Bacteroidales bacterium]|nr:DnaJ domain-containing protein [Bacteroidales bacterium]HOH94064.1 DnaJ domain-containing protein [Bacteroidales bacterium]HPB19979.1 DnaJ domain-containing protein [Bacteroidales bacterium]HQM78311.1 DnaJ domain-containing protein [Bacteroidales bacterium]